MGNLLQIDSKLLSVFNYESINDNALNGVQIEGSADVSRIAVSVDAGMSTLEAAIARNANFLFVHHGIFWGKDQALKGPHKRLIEAFFDAGVTLYALHLPLDTHPQFGNSTLLAEYLGLRTIAPAAYYLGSACGVIAENEKGLSRDELATRLAALDGAIPQFCSLPFGPDIPKRICIVSGAGCDQLMAHQNDNFDTLITGEPRQFAYHYSKEHQLNALFPGHYATETLGIQAVGRLLSSEFSLEWDYISEPTGI